VAATTTTSIPAPSATVFGGFGTDLGTAQASTVVSQGGSIDVVGSGYLPGASVQVVLHSTPVLLAVLTADASGNISAHVSLPAAAPIGAHTVELVGQAASGAVTTVSLPLTVVPSGILPVTGADLGSWPLGAVLLLAGVVVLWIRRRPREFSSTGV
jgi:hypothetical protein